MPRFSEAVRAMHEQADAQGPKPQFSPGWFNLERVGFPADNQIQIFLLRWPVPG